MKAHAAAGSPVVVFDRGGWWVMVEADGRTQEYRCSSEDHARRFAETLARLMPRTHGTIRGVRPLRREPEPLPVIQVLKKSHV